MTETTHYHLKKPTGNDFVGPGNFNDNADLIDAALHGLEEGKLAKDPQTGKLPEGMLPPAPTNVKTSPVDADWVTLTDTQDSNARKKLTWDRIKAALKGYFDNLYAAAAHSHAWSAITDKPSGFPPSTHTHPASDIASGTLSTSRLPTVPVAKGGTGASTAAGARSNLGACANALESATAAALGLTGDATVNEGLAKLALGPFEIGDTLSTLRTDLGDKWLLCNGEDLDTNTYPELAKKTTELNFSDFITEGYATGEIYSEAEYGGVYVQAGQITSTYGGAYKALLWYSTNPRGSTNDWNKCTLSEFFDGILTKVRVHNGTWVAVGYQRDNLYPYILTTTNPKGTWTVKQLLKTPCMLSGLVYAFNKWVAVGSVGSGQPKVFTATDPSGSWSDGVLSTTTNLNITNIAFNGTFLCAVGYDNSDVPYLVKNTSLSGTWETTRMTISNQPTSHPKIHPNSIAFSNGNWVVGCAVDEVNDYTWLARILVSSDLVTWTYKKIKSSDLTYVHAKYGAFVNFYNNKWYVTSSMERDQSYLCWTDNLGDSWSVKKLSSSGCCVKGADVANGYLFILGREYRSEKVGYYVVNKILPRISLNGVYTYIKAKE